MTKYLTLTEQHYVFTKVTMTIYSQMIGIIAPRSFFFNTLKA